MDEIKSWLKQVKLDLKAAKNSHKSKDYHICAFLSQQAVEKTLKALFIKRYKRLWKIHDLVKLGEKVEIPDDMLDICERLSRHYIATRYPLEVKYTRKDAEKAIDDSKKVIKWVLQKLKS